MERLTYRLSTRVYSNSHKLKNIILKNRLTSEDKLSVIGRGSSNGIDTSFFNPELFSIGKNNSLKFKLGIKINDFVLSSLID
jgi:hypothetical protein